MFFCKTINSCCKDVVLNEPHIFLSISCCKDVVLNEPHIFFINKCCNYTNLDATIHVLTPKSAG